MTEIPPLPELQFLEIPASSRHRYAGDRFCYMEAGDRNGRPILLLHGIGANSMHWRFQFAALADRFWLVAWNAPGYLLSDNLRAETPGCCDYADALADFAMALEIGAFDLVANSFGTRVAQCFFAHHDPGRIGRAVFTGTSVAQSRSLEERSRDLEARAHMIERGGYGFGERAAALLGSAASADTVALVRDTLRATNPEGFMQAARFGTAGEVPPLGSGMAAVPVLIIQGEEDRVTPAAANAELLAAVLPQSRLVKLAGCGHLPEVEFPDRVNDLIRDHLAGAPS
jgi:pimeloyl-ACP methyl ester carboxylesterase